MLGWKFHILHPKHWKKESLTSAKDKILHCSTISDAICTSSLRSSTDFPKVLGLAMDTFLLCCDDENSDLKNQLKKHCNICLKTYLVLGQFASDKEIKILLKAFLSNLVSSSTIVRRAAASSLTSVCLNSRRPSSFFSWILLALFDLILPVHDDHSTYVILGVLLCLRHIVPHLSKAMMSPNSKSGSIIQNEEEMIVTKEQLLKIYKLVLHFSNHPDHNVITATLETLYHLLKCAPKVLQHELTSPYGITKSLIFDVPKLNRAMSESNFFFPLLEKHFVVVD
ncbi:huntingtin [Caerostris extrusa]|uniref:Huntingtin n=1 Tax=Caerostris extrusa TaxID=172846 RepID=A0AAV4S7W2_CAEEX|nr:huntingtin [Caerostris extrusa]